MTAADLMAVCTCGHYRYAHQLNPKKIRTWCTHGEAAGQCPCKRYEEA